MQGRGHLPPRAFRVCYRDPMGCALWLCMLAVASPAFAQPSDPRAPSADDEAVMAAQLHYRLGRQAYDAGRFEEAAREFEQSYAISNQPRVLYNIYVARRDADQMPGAIEALRQYLELVPDAPDRVELRARLATLEQLYGSQLPPPEEDPDAPIEVEEDPQEPVDVEPTEPATPTASPPPPRASFPVLPVVVISTGGAMVLTSFITGAIALGKEADLEELCPGDRCPAGSEWMDLADSGETLAAVTDVLLIGGIAVAGTGIAMLFLLDDDDAPAETPTASAMCTGDGCVAHLRGTF